MLQHYCAWRCTLFWLIPHIQIQYGPLSLHVANTICICSPLAGHILLSGSFWCLLPGLELLQVVPLFLLSNYLTTICWWWLLLLLLLLLSSSLLLLLLFKRWSLLKDTKIKKNGRKVTGLNVGARKLNKGTWFLQCCKSHVLPLAAKLKGMIASHRKGLKGVHDFTI